LSSTDLAGLDINPSDMKLPRFSPDELMGRRTFIRQLDDSTSYRAKILRKIQDNDAENHNKIKFLVELGDGDFDKIISYNTLCDLVEDQHDENDLEEKVWVVKSVQGHQGPLKKKDPTYKGSSYNVLVEWEDGSQTYEPLDIIIRDDPVTLAMYAKKNNLLDQPVWKRLKHVARNLVPNKLDANSMTFNVCAGRQTKVPVYQFGIQVPRNVKQAYELDNRNGNTKWTDAIKEEMDSLQKFNTFKDVGKVPFLADHKKIVVHFVFAVKDDLSHRARLVAGGHLTDPTTDGTYSSVVSFCSMRIAIVAAELNNLDIMVGDVSSTYLEAYTQEKVCFQAGPEFGPLEGHLLVIVRALYGLRTSSAC
jgi:hypothetical protein